MKVGKLSCGSPPFLCVTWKITDFYQLAEESGRYLRSPEFPFADGRYCLRLFPFTDSGFYIRIDLVNLTDAFPGRHVSYEVLSKSSSGVVSSRGVITDLSRSPAPVFYLKLRFFPGLRRDSYFPDGNVTVVCFVRLMEPSNAVIPESRAPETEPAISRFRMGGELSFESPPFLYVTWEIPNFFSRFVFSESEYEYSLVSPVFPFADGRYCLRWFLFRKCDSGFFGTQLLNLIDGDLGRDVSYQLGLKSRTGKEIDLKHAHGIYQSEVEENKDSYVPDGTLTVFCFVVHTREPNSAGGPAETAEEEEEEQERVPGLLKLQSDLRQLLKKRAESDACLVVSGKEFRAHKNILRSRSPVFEAMFYHDTAEKKSGRVVIDDLDPEIFGDFLEYLYTGDVEASLSNDNAFGLYKAADKYDVPILKSECLVHIRRNMSVDSFCDVITLAFQHQEEKLLQRAVMFFKENMARIIVTAKWQQFVIDNGRSANELLIKAVVPEGQ